MFEKNLQIIKNDIKYYKRDRDELIKYYITKRLNESLNSYYYSINRSSYALSVSDPEKVIGKM